MLPYLRVANVQDGFLDLTEIKEIEVLQEDLKKYLDSKMVIYFLLKVGIEINLGEALYGEEKYRIASTRTTFSELV